MSLYTKINENKNIPQQVQKNNRSTLKHPIRLGKSSITRANFPLLSKGFIHKHDAWRLLVLYSRIST